MKECPFNSRGKCDIWVDYQVACVALQEAEELCAFCGARRTLMRFRADAMQSITDAPKRSILLFSSSAGLLLYSASSPA